MKTFYKYIGLAIILLSYSCKNESDIKPITNAESIVENYFDAIGGYEKLKNIKSLIKKGHYIEPAYNIVIPAQQLKMRPNFRKIGDLETVGFEEGFNGSAWEYHKGKGLIISKGEAKEAIVVASDFDFPFMDAKEKGYTLKLNGQKKINGQQTYDLELVMPFENSEYITNYYFSTSTGLLIGQRKVMPIHAKGSDVDIIVLYSDYRDVNGVLYPFSQMERNEKTGKFLNATIWSEFVPNTNITKADFNPPNN